MAGREEKGGVGAARDYIVSNDNWTRSVSVVLVKVLGAMATIRTDATN